MNEEDIQTYEKKKGLILKTLAALSDVWDMAKPIYDHVSGPDVKPDFIDDMLDMIDVSLKQIETDDRMNKMKDTMASINRSKLSEESERSQEISDSANLFNVIV